MQGETLMLRRTQPSDHSKFTTGVISGVCSLSSSSSSHKAFKIFIRQQQQIDLMEEQRDFDFTSIFPKVRCRVDMSVLERLLNG